jgi:hypothetical protein
MIFNKKSLANLSEKTFKAPIFANGLLIKTIRKSQRKKVSGVLYLLTVDYIFPNPSIINGHKTVIKSLKNPLTKLFYAVVISPVRTGSPLYTEVLTRLIQRIFVHG